MYLASEAEKPVWVSLVANPEDRSYRDEALILSDIVYKQAVEILERTRSSWETDMEEACEVRALYFV